MATDETLPSISSSGEFDLIAFAKKELEADAERHAKATALNTSDLPKESQTGFTLDLSHKKITILPVEVINLIKNNVERLALSHNPRIVVPKQLVQCDRLRYLNLRWNQLGAFPEPVLGLNKLEILDISKNNIVTIPEEIGRMTSLKFLAAARNQITRLPLALGDMVSLSKLKYDENPIEFPPPEALRPSPNHSGQLDKEKDICLAVKRYLRDCAAKERSRPSTSDEQNESSTETPRPPRRTGTGTRFPVRPSISGIDIPSEDLKSSRPRDTGPLFPSKSHTRAGSTTNGTQFRRVNTTSPLSIPSSPRNRSETVSSAASVRSRRQGFVTRRFADGEFPFDFGQQVSDPTNTVSSQSYAHSRTNSSLSTLSSSLMAEHDGRKISGTLSQVSKAMTLQPINTLHSDSGPSRTQNSSLRFQEVGRQCQRLHVVLSQLYLPLNNMSLTVKEFGLQYHEIERLLINASTRLQELGHTVNHLSSPADGGKDSQQTWTRAAASTASNALKSYGSIIRSLKQNAFRISAAKEAFHLRAVLHQSFYSIHEAHNICKSLKAHTGEEIVATPRVTRRPHAVEARVPTPTHPKSINNRRLRGATILRSMSSTTGLRAVPPPVPSIIAAARTNTGVLHARGLSRTQEALGSFSAAVPSTRNIPARSVTEDSRAQFARNATEEQDTDEQFDRIFLRLKSACDLTYQSLPEYRRECSIRREHANGVHQTNIANLWSVSIHRIEVMISANNTLMSRLKVVKVKDPGIRTQKEFWQLCDSFVNAWADVGLAMQDLSKYRVDINRLKTMMRPVQRAMKEVSKLISESSLYHQTVRSNTSNVAVPTLAPAFQLNSGLSYHTNGSFGITSPHNYQTPVPATPLSAALGPAVQATVASAPASTLTPMEYT